MSDNEQEPGANRRKPTGFIAEAIAAKAAAPEPVDDWGDPEPAPTVGLAGVILPVQEEEAPEPEIVDLGAASQFEDDPELIAPPPAPKLAERPAMRPSVERPSIRPPAPVEEGSRARAARRAAELRGYIDDDMEDGNDEFYIDPRAIPAGWSYEWKRRTVLNAEDPSYQVALAQKGWEPVPAKRHPELMPLGYNGSYIERKGMILMERPMEITQERMTVERRKAAAQVRQKEAQLSQAQQGQFGRTDSKGNSLVKVGKSYEAMPIPED